MDVNYDSDQNKQTQEAAQALVQLYFTTLENHFRRVIGYLTLDDLGPFVRSYYVKLHKDPVNEFALTSASYGPRKAAYDTTITQLKNTGDTRRLNEIVECIMCVLVISIRKNTTGPLQFMMIQEVLMQAEFDFKNKLGDRIEKVSDKIILFHEQESPYPREDLVLFRTVAFHIAYRLLEAIDTGKYMSEVILRGALRMLSP